MSVRRITGGEFRRRAAACLLAAIGLVVVPMFAGQAASAAAAPTTVYGYVCTSGQLRIRPSRLYLACGDGNSYVAGIRWADWAGRTAVGSGIWYVNDCKPNCAAGTFHHEPATVELSARTSFRGHSVYGYLTAFAAPPDPLHFDAQATSVLPLIDGQRSGPGQSVLVDSEDLPPSSSLFSSSFRYSLSMQSDGNLVVYRRSPNGRGSQTALWQSGTAGSPGSVLWLQSDGNLVLYSRAHIPLWQSHTAGHAGDRLIVQSDGNVVIYSSTGRPLWQTHTYAMRP